MRSVFISPQLLPTPALTLLRPQGLAPGLILNLYLCMGIREFFGLKPKVDTSTLPSNVGKLTGNKAFGPNCWNATMLYFHTDEITRYVEPEEMTQWLEKHTTEDQYKRCAPGSILVLHLNVDDDRTVNRLWHTAVWVAPGILWHKFGCSGPWEFITEKRLRLMYPEATDWKYRIFKEKT